jgi:hypothetical protein
MLPPRHMKGPKHSLTRWYCRECEPMTVLGRVYTTPGGDRLLKPGPALQLVMMRGVGEWRLICEHGHATLWDGAGIRLEARQEAA